MISAYCFAAALVKLSLLVFFNRIFSPLRRSKLLIWIAITFTVTIYVVFFITWIIYTVPHRNNGGWTNLTFRLEVNRQTPKLSVGLGTLSTFTDFYVVAIPLTTISGLNLPRAKKIGVSTLFATGLLSV